MDNTVSLQVEVLDIFNLEDGRVVVGGSNECLDSISNDEIQDKFSRIVEIVSPKGKRSIFSVQGVDISTSLIGKKNIFLILPIKEKSLVANGSVLIPIDSKP